jgi:hypothetical protein
MRETPGGLRGTTPVLNDPTLAVLAHLAASQPTARVRIEQPQMTDVFRRVLSERGSRT